MKKIMIIDLIQVLLALITLVTWLIIDTNDPYLKGLETGFVLPTLIFFYLRSKFY
jgi:hypothetical protein